MLRDWTLSDRVNSMSVHAERFFVRLIMKVDDHGCFHADSRVLKSFLYPLLSDSIREADLVRWMAECQKADLIVIYESSGKKYLQIKDFRQRLDRANSKYPLPLIENQSVSVGQPVVNETPPEVEVELEVEVPNGTIGETPKPATYSETEKTKEGIYNFIKTQQPKEPEPYIDFWNMFAKEKGFPTVQTLNAARKRKLRIRIGEKAFDYMKILYKAGQSEFIRSKSFFTFDWMIENETNYVKIMDGNYDNKDQIEKPLRPIGSKQQQVTNTPTLN